MSDGPMGEPPNTSSTLSLQPLKLIEYPPNAAFLAFAIFYSLPQLWLVASPGCLACRGYQYHRCEGDKMKNTTAWGPSPRARYPLTVSGSQLRNWKILSLHRTCRRRGRKSCASLSR